MNKRSKIAFFAILLTLPVIGFIGVIGWAMESLALVYMSAGLLGIDVIAVMVIVAVTFYIEEIKG